MVLLALAVTLTEPQAILFVPLAVWRFLKVPAVRPVVCGYAVGLAAQVLSTLLAGRSRTGGLPPPVGRGGLLGQRRPVDVHRQRSVDGLADLAPRLVGVAGRGAGVHAVRSVRVGVWPAIAWLAVVTLVLGSLAVWCSSYIFNNDANLYYSHFELERFLDLTLTRYGAAPAMMLASMVPLAVGVLLERRPALLPLAVGVVAGLVVEHVAELRAAGQPPIRCWVDGRGR